MGPSADHQNSRSKETMTLMWVPRHLECEDNETADGLAKRDARHNDGFICWPPLSEVPSLSKQWAQWICVCVVFYDSYDNLDKRIKRMLGPYFPKSYWASSDV